MSIKTTMEWEPTNARPFLRWAGSKRKLIKYLLPFIPSSWNKYYEPFLGSGALFFYLGPARAEISDASLPLIQTYKSVKRAPAQVLEYLRPLKPDKITFDRIRKQEPRSDTDAAGSFIFLNKACWNGLYRVNSNGIFNVPYGSPKTDFLINEENFKRCSVLLRQRRVSVRHQDFSAISKRVRAGDFVFLDPPYVTSHNMNGFVDWNEALFSWDDQIRLANLARLLVRRGANVLVTNANHPSVLALYKSFGVHTFNRTSTLAGDVTKRGSTRKPSFLAAPIMKLRIIPCRVPQMAANIELLDPGKIHPNPDNPRLIFRLKELEELESSIASQGILVPLTVYQDRKKYVLLDGERRWRCAKKLALHRIPAIIQPKPERIQNIMMMFAIHNARRDWDPLPTALKLKELEDELSAVHGKRLSEAALAASASLSRGTVRRLRKILNIPDDIQKELIRQLDNPQAEQTLSVDQVIEAVDAAEALVEAKILEPSDERPFVDTIIEKFQDSIIKNTVEPRKLGKVARAVAKGELPARRAKAAVARFTSRPK